MTDLDPVIHAPARLRIAWAWRLSIGELIGFVALCVVIVVALVKDDDPPGAVLGSALVLGVFAAMIGWRVLAQLLNHTVIEAGDGQLVVETAPIVVSGRLVLDRQDIDQLYCTMQTTKRSAWFDLHARLRRGVDGLQLETETRRAVFLPVMWEQLPEPRDFVGHLLRKAGIRESEPFTAQRFEARVFSD